MFYFVTEILLCIVFLLIPKSKEKQNFFIWIPVTVITYYCYTIFMAGVLSILHISACVVSIGVINVLLSIAGIVYLRKKSDKQCYFIDVWDAVFLFVYIALIVYVFDSRFTGDLRIIFETSDPGTHLKLAMNFVNQKSVSGMYAGSVINGLFVDAMSWKFSGAYIYKSFIINCGINYFLSGLMFYAATIGFVKKDWQKLVVYITTIIYVMGYPLNDLLYGFLYLQITITIISYLFFVVKIYMMDKTINPLYARFFMSLGCLAVGVGYSLFAPLVFVVLLLCITYNFWKEKKLFGKYFFSKQYIVHSLQVFLMPTVFVLWFMILYPNIFGSGATNFGSAINMEGAIYRNLYSDFIIYILFALYGMITAFKKRDILFHHVLLPGGILYTLFFAFRMFHGKVSTYYYYKLNYLLWMIILVSFVEGIIILLEREFVLIMTYVMLVACVFTLYITNFEEKSQEKNVNTIPFCVASNFYRVNYFNSIIRQNKTEINQELVKISDLVCQKYKTDTSYDTEQTTIIIGNWMYLYWYEALINQRMSQLVNRSVEQNVNEFQQGHYGEFMVILKDSEEYMANQGLLDSLNKVYEDEYAMIVQR